MENNKPTPVFVDGLYFNKKRDGAPDYVKGSISIDVEKFGAFLRNSAQYVSEKGYLTVDLKQSQKGSLYFQVNTYKADMARPESLGSGRVSDEEAATLERLRNSHNEASTNAGEFANTPF